MRDDARPPARDLVDLGRASAAGPRTGRSRCSRSCTRTRVRSSRRCGRSTPSRRTSRARSRRSSAVNARSRRSPTSGPRAPAGDADRCRWGRQDPPRAPGGGRGRVRLPRRRVAVRARAGHRSRRGVGDVGGEPAGAAVARPDARGVGARVPRAEACALLVLDNCEHLLDAIARQVDAILRSGVPRLAVLATSREGLALAGERIVAVPSLRVPRGRCRRVDELMRRRRGAAVRGSGERDAGPTSRSPSATRARSRCLCRRLDGIPLAIELAAPRVRSMSAEDLVSRLDQRFKLLTQGSRAALERHQTLRNTIDWSYDLLDPTERQALNRLSVFAGGCDLVAAEAVLSGVDLDRLDVADVLGQLVDKSLVVARRQRRRRRRATGCSRPSASTPKSSSRPAARPRRFDAAARRALRRGGRSGRSTPAEPGPDRLG